MFSHQAQIGVQMVGPEWDFWKPDVYRAFFPGDNANVAVVKFQGIMQQGIWKRAEQAQLPMGVICRSQPRDTTGTSSGTSGGLEAFSSLIGSGEGFQAAEADVLVPSAHSSSSNNVYHEPPKASLGSSRWYPCNRTTRRPDQR